MARPACFLLLCLVFLNAGCVILPPAVKAELDPRVSAVAGDDIDVADLDTPLRPPEYLTRIVAADIPHESVQAGLPLRSGQIILSDQANAESVFVSMIGEEFRPFVHAGLIVLEDDDAYVYESFGLIGFFIGGPPTDAVGGGVRRVTLRSYLRRVQIVAIYQPPSSIDTQAVIAYAHRQLQMQTPFDAYFDSHRSDRLYCSEFIAQALQAGGAPAPPATAVRANPSLAVVLHWLKIEAPAIIQAGSLVEGWQRVALLSRYYSLLELDNYFAGERELHRRFTDTQTLGSIFRWSLGTLQLRPEVGEFLHDCRCVTREARATF